MMKKFEYKFKHINDTSWSTVTSVPEYIEKMASLGISYVRYVNEFDQIYEYRIAEIELSAEDKLLAILDHILEIADKGSQPLYTYLGSLEQIKKEIGEYYD